jgi:signal transduction histidine kinase
MNEYLRQLNEEKNKFIGIAAHDIRSPVSTIKAFSDLLLSEHANHISPETKRIINYIKDLSENSLVLLGNLLNISVIESGKINLNKTNQDYLIFVKQNIYLNQILADKKGITINLECSDKFVILEFDEHYMQEVLNNLLSNAIKFSFPNNKILVRISRTDNNMVKTEIIDNGIGIPDSEQSNLFKYFQTASSRPTSGEKSTGLGLAIIKKIIDEHQGTVNLKSSASGSNFYFILPGLIK